MRLNDFLERLSARKGSSGTWTARCPAHDDRTPSLSISEGGDGRILLHCHAGCEPKQVTDALGINLGDLFHNPGRPERRIAEVYEYGSLQVVRFEPKDFRVRRPDGHGRYIWSSGGIPFPLYHQDDLQGQQRVLVAEGEKDTDRLRAIGFSATCNAGGAGQWESRYSAALAQAGVREVVVIPDADEVGRAHGMTIARMCAEADIKVQIAKVPAGAKDVSAFLDSGGSVDAVKAMIAEAEPYRPSDPEECPILNITSATHRGGKTRVLASAAADAGHVEPAQPFEVESADESEPPQRKWLIPGWLPCGRLASIYGRGEAGKSRLMLHVAHAVACGGPVLPWDPRVKDDAVRGDVPQVADVGRVLLVTWEDEAAEVRRRWRMAHAAGAVDTERMPAEIAILDMRRHGAGPLWAPHGKGSGHVSTRGEWTEAGRRILAMLPGCDLAVLDPLASAYACSEIDRALVRGFAARLDAEAEAAGCAVVLSAHPSRAGERDGSAESGSTDWRNAVRSRWILGPQRTAHNALGADGKDAPIDAPCLALDKASYAPGRGRVWLRSHYRRDDDPDKWNELAWFATTDWAAAVAAHVRDGGKAGDVINIGVEKAAGKRGDKSVENPDRAYV